MREYRCYELRGDYPDKTEFHAIIFAQSDTDAIAIAQGLRKVTTIMAIWVYNNDNGLCIFHDHIEKLWVN